MPEKYNLDTYKAGWCWCGHHPVHGQGYFSTDTEGRGLRRYNHSEKQWDQIVPADQFNLPGTRRGTLIALTRHGFTLHHESRPGRSRGRRTW